MKIIVNGDPHEITATHLVQALEELGYHDAIVATAVNKRFVPLDRRATHLLCEGDQIELVAPMQGG